MLSFKEYLQELNFPEQIKSKLANKVHPVKDNTGMSNVSKPIPTPEPSKVTIPVVRSSLHTPQIRKPITAK